VYPTGEACSLKYTSKLFYLKINMDLISLGALIKTLQGLMEVGYFPDTLPIRSSNPRNTFL